MGILFIPIPHPPQYLVLPVMLILAILVGRQWYLIVVQSVNIFKPLKI